jgi:hypothetical protein
LADEQKEASTVATSRGVESNSESQSGNFGDSETTSDNSGHLKVAAAAALARISYNIGPSTITKTCIRSMESYARYFPMGYGRPLGAESVSEPRAKEDVVFKEIFAARLHITLHPVLVDILC